MPQIPSRPPIFPSEIPQVHTQPRHDNTFREMFEGVDFVALRKKLEKITTPAAQKWMELWRK